MENKEVNAAYSSKSLFFKKLRPKYSVNHGVGKSGEVMDESAFDKTMNPYIATVIYLETNCRACSISLTKKSNSNKTYQTHMYLQF